MSGQSGEPGRRRPALSPSRAADFKQCPLLYRFRAIDRLPEVSSLAQVRGTLVHAVLDRLFTLPAAQRVPAVARALVGPVWAGRCPAAPGLAPVPAGAPAADPPPDDAPQADQARSGPEAGAGPLLDAY